jgi:hypothetical protein
MKSYFLVLQNVNIEEKIKNAPNEGYEIGVLIGSYLPFVLLVVLAYWTYSRAKKRKE